MQKVARVNVNNPKSNSGGVLLKLSDSWETLLEGYVNDTFAILQQQFAKDSTDSPVGTAKLTSVSLTIGSVISKHISRTPLPWSMEVRLGDLFIEAFEEAGLISLYYPKVRDSSYIVSATLRWTELAEIPEALSKIRLIGSSLTKPDVVTEATQEVCGREATLTKGGSHKLDLSAPWVSALSKLQRVGWRINERVLEALLANADLFTSDIPIKDNDAREQKRRSKKVEWSFITKKAMMLKDADVFYQYVDADYRGRLYYMEPFLNFQGPDAARSLLQFARGKPMTDEGLQWLAIHTASSFNMSYGIDEVPDWCTSNYVSHLKDEGLDNISVDKMTLADRIEWTNQYMKEIVDAGTIKDFSKEAEKPVAFLAACCEWADIADAAADNRIHMSHLPIPIDGSNNGWQHLGAISKDEKTGRLVGLTPVEIQQDFYVQTAKRLIADNRNERLTSILNAMPMKSIRKGISKRGSMTRAYSAGVNKIAENMFFDCKAEDFHITYGIDKSDCTKLAKRLIKAIDQVCPGPLSTMSYLQNIAKYEIGTFTRVYEDGTAAGKDFTALDKRRKELYRSQELSDEEMDELDTLTKEVGKYKFVLTKGNGQSRLQWSTPSGFNVNYESWITKSSKCHGSIGTRRVYHVAQLPTDIPDIRGFMCGISPNFIHSMDAAHMALVIAEWNGEFAAVHDSFSSHASDVDALLDLTKETFISIYNKENIYEDIETNILTTPSTSKLGRPKYGQLDIEGIRQSEYFFA